MKSQSLFLSVVVGIALSSICTESASAVFPSTESGNVDSSSTQEESDIASYAKEFGTSIDEASRRSKILAARGDLAANLRSEFESRFAGLYLEHVPNLTIYVRLTGQTPEASRSVNTADGAIAIIFLSGAISKLSEIEAAINRQRGNLFSSLPSLQDIYADERTGEVVLTFYATEDEANVFSSETTNLTKLIGHPVRIEIEGAQREEISRLRGGALMTTCTSGFSVRETSTGRLGIITAAHCGNDQGYANYVPPGEPGYFYTPLAFIAEIDDSQHDVQWHIPTLGTPIGEVYGSSTSEAQGRAIILTISRAGTMIGDFICHRGEATGYSCGRVVSTTSAAHCGKLGGYCGNTWVRLKGPNLACSSGDSGGPFFYVNSGYGIAKDASAKNREPGGCYSISYMSLDYISTLGLRLR